jgi:MGT family glycosyltransferase
MPHFLMSIAPSAGHVAPSLRIARKLTERGHKVVLMTGRLYREKVESTGARFHALPDEIDPGEREIYDFYPQMRELTGLAQIKFTIKHMFLDTCPRLIEEVDAVLADFPADVLVGDAAAFAIGFKSEMGGPPFAHISLVPVSQPSPDTAPFGLGLLPGTNVLTKSRNRLLNALTYRVFLRDITVYANKIRRQLGLGPLKAPFFEAAWKMARLHLHLSTPAFEYSRRNQPTHFHFTGPILPESDPRFQPPPWWTELDGSGPVVLVNQGTVAKNLDDLIAPTIEGLKGERVLVVAVPVEDGRLGELPANVRAEPFIPFDHLFPHVDVFVTNGGYGGTQWALSHGVPLVVGGATEDKMEVAARVEWAGAGINLRRQRPSPGRVRSAVKEVLANSTYRHNAERIQADFAGHDAPTRAAELLEALAAGKL